MGNTSATNINVNIYICEAPILCRVGR